MPRALRIARRERCLSSNMTIQDRNGEQHAHDGKDYDDNGRQNL